MTTSRNHTLVILLACLVVACLCPTGNVDTHIPEEGKVGLKPLSIREIGYPMISEYMDVDSQQVNYALGVFSGTAEDGSRRIRGWLIKNEKNEPVREAYLGEFTHQFDDLPVQTLMFEANGMRFIAGYVEPHVPGTMDEIVFTRYKSYHEDADMRDWRKVSNIESERIFLFPIFSSEMEAWDKIDFLGVITNESLNQVAGHVSSHCDSDIYEICIVYDRPKYIGDLFLPDPLANEGE